MAATIRHNRARGKHKSDAYKKYLDLMRRRKEAWGVNGLQLSLLEQQDETA
jgi:hypothetical protein